VLRHCYCCVRNHTDTDTFTFLGAAFTTHFWLSKVGYQIVAVVFGPEVCAVPSVSVPFLNPLAYCRTQLLLNGSPK
jgi:hypothetical protein